MRLQIAFALSLVALAQATGGDNTVKPLPGRSGGYSRPVPNSKPVWVSVYSDDKLHNHMEHVEDYQREYNKVDEVYPGGGNANKVRTERKHGQLQHLGPHPITGLSQVKDEKVPAGFKDPKLSKETTYRAVPYYESGGYSKSRYLQDNPRDTKGLGYDNWKKSDQKYVLAEQKKGEKVYSTEGGMLSGAKAAMDKGLYSGLAMETSRGWHPLGDQRRAHEEPSRTRPERSRDRRGTIAYPDQTQNPPSARQERYETGGRARTDPDPYWTKALDSDGQPLTGVPHGYVFPAKTIKDTFDPERPETWQNRAPSDRYARSSHPPRPKTREDYDESVETKPRGPVTRPPSTKAYDMDSLRDALPDDRRDRRGRDRPPVSSARFFENQPSSSSSSSRRESSRVGRSSSSTREPFDVRDSSRSRRSDSIRESSSARSSSQLGRSRSTREQPSARSSSRLGRSDSVSVPSGSGTVQLTSDYRGRGTFYDYDPEYDGRPQSHSAPHCYSKFQKRGVDGETSAGCDVQPQETNSKPAAAIPADKSSTAPANKAQVVPPVQKISNNAGGTSKGLSATPAVSAEKKPVGHVANSLPAANPNLATPVKAAPVKEAPKAKEAPKVKSAPGVKAPPTNSKLVRRNWIVGRRR
ncbi:hypothetical protein MCOR25_010167 [Pyricularia grisea]|uniref:Uncharacterized protein n=1 Tax=Pyricularia grisea TaxID=148305 RepID=A0A6P8ANR0_PYRGI|nr:uncharacterized protein PgNI_11816 [Pyricularia grisea]KAI6351073.1 hypothetical protein MCOR25_010167 [Pyricularia grisea]TLD03670.1 hypothetical protein PgNI_11816 [Pyricularia grisea]